MNRQQRRQELREGKKTTDRLKSWLSSLTAEQRRLFSLTVGQEVDRISRDTELVIDSCYATAIDDNLDIEPLEIKKIVVEASKYMEEVKEYLSKNREGYFVKIEDEKLINEVKKDIVDLMKSATVKSKALTQLKKKYNLPANVLNDLWLQVKSENSKAYNKHTPTKFKGELAAEKEKMLNDIGLEQQKVLNKEIATDAELPYVVTEKELEEEVKVPTTIKKVCETFRGANGTIYERSEEGVKTAKRTFKDIKDLEQYKSGVQSEFNSKKELIKEEVEKWNKKLEEVNEEENREFNFINEVEEVFKA